jgi:hypothetical protein
LSTDLIFLDIEDPWDIQGWGARKRKLNEAMIEQLRRGRVEGIDDLKAASALTEQIYSDLSAYGTSGGGELTDQEIVPAIRALTSTLSRLKVSLDLPFRDYLTFRSYWMRNGAHGSWEARRRILGEFFDPAFAQLLALEDLPISPRALAEPALNAISDPSVIFDHLRRLDSSIDNDPRLAVSVAKELVESTAKIVLTKCNLSYSNNDNLMVLVTRAQEALAVHATDFADGSEESNILRRVLGSLSNLVKGIGELRNEVGTAHGRETIPIWVGPRHARLAAGAASTWCNFMLETLGDPSAPWQSKRI